MTEDHRLMIEVTCFQGEIVVRLHEDLPEIFHAMAGNRIEETTEDSTVEKTNEDQNGSTGNGKEIWSVHGEIRHQEDSKADHQPKQPPMSMRHTHQLQTRRLILPDWPLLKVPALIQALVEHL